MIEERLGPRGLHKGTELKRDIKWLLLCQHTFKSIAKKLDVSLATVEEMAVEIIEGRGW